MGGEGVRRVKGKVEGVKGKVEGVKGKVEGVKGRVEGRVEGGVLLFVPMKRLPNKLIDSPPTPTLSHSM